MNMKTSLIITGDSKVAQDAINQLKGGVDQLGAASRGAIAPQRDLAAAVGTVQRAANDAADAAGKEAEAIKRATQARVQAGGAIVTSAGQQRAAMQSLGAQLNDFSTQVLGGVSPMVAFTQQSGQMAYAMSGMGGVAGTVGRFLGGPFGSLVLIGATVLGTIAMKSLDGADAMDELADKAGKAADAADSFGNAQSLLGKAIDLTTGKLKTQNEALKLSIELQARANILRAQTDQAAARKALGNVGEVGGAGSRTSYGRIGFLNASADPVGGLVAAQQVSREEDRLKGLRDLRDGVISGKVSPKEVSTRLQALVKGGVISDEASIDIGIQLNNLAIAKNDETANQLVIDALSGKGVAAALVPYKRDKVAKPRKAASSDGLVGSVRGDIASVLAEFQGLPTFLQKAQAATAKLDADIAQLEKRKPPNFGQLIADAKAAKQVIADNLAKPFDDFVKQQRESLTIGRLLAAGREDEASALRNILRLQQQIGPLTEDQRATVLDLAQQETAINDALEKRRELIGNYSQALSQIRGDLTSLLSGQSSAGDFLSSYKKTFQQLQGKLLAENLFGDAFRQLQDFVEGRTGVTAAVDVMSSEAARAGSSAGRLADALDAAAGRVVGASPAGGGLEPYTQAGNLPPATVADLLRQVPIAGGGLDNDTQGAPIEVLGINPNGVNKLSASEFLQKTNDKLAGNLTGALDKQFGTKFFSENLAKPISGALTGYATAGPVGAALGALKDLKGLPAGLQKGLSKGLEGAQTGTMVAGIGKALGIKMSSTGAQIGGAIGSALPIPGGQIIGSIIGGLAGGLFGSTPKGSATITGTGAKDVSVTGSEKYRTTLGAAADTIQGNLDRIAQALGGDATGAFSVSIGIRDGKYRVDPTGAGRTKKGKGVVDYGKDGAEAAVAAATADAIADGAIEGLSRAVQQAIKSSPNLDKSIAEALKVQDVELVLGGIGAVMERQFRDQERQAKERVRIATQYGFDVVAIEKKNAEERAALAEKLLQSQVGSLQNLVDELTRGSLFEGSGADQRTALLSAIDTAKADLAAGKDGAGDKLADLLGQLNSVSKDYYGSTGQFAADRSMILDQARTAIADSNARIAAAQSSSASDPALATTNQALDENNDQNAQMLTKQDEIIALLSRLGGGGGGDSPASGGGAIGFSELFNMARTK